MFKIVLILICMLMVGGLILFTYQKLFQSNIQKTLNHQEALKLPDLNDVVVSYIVICVGIFLMISMQISINTFKDDVGTCVKEAYDIEGISDDFEICINAYDNVIFKNQKDILEKIFTKYQIQIQQINHNKISTDEIDNLYYLARKELEDEDILALRTHLKIYRNFYETEKTDDTIEKGFQS